MTFSWTNKTRRNRFSQLVADHFKSSKRPRPLVVETGFPTSLIDLYVRNRGRFRKPSVNKKRGNGSSNCSSSGDSNYKRTDEVVEEGVVVDGGIKTDKYGKTEGELIVEMAKLKHVLMVLLKVLIIVVLVFGTKRFTVMITLLAFLLLFIESVGKRLSRRSTSMRRSVDSKQTATVVVCSDVLGTEQVESKQQDVLEKESDEARSEVFIEIKHKSSRLAMMKSKIKKLVPKKLRKSSMDSKHELFGELNEEAVRSAHNAKPLVCANECSESKGRRSVSSTLSSETEGNGEEFRTELRQNSDCLVLFFIVLVGLIGGRVFALAIALSWCLMLKLQWRHVKFPIFRC